MTRDHLRAPNSTRVPDWPKIQILKVFFGSYYVHQHHSYGGRETIEVCMLDRQFPNEMDYKEMVQLHFAYFNRIWLDVYMSAG